MRYDIKGSKAILMSVSTLCLLTMTSAHALENNASLSNLAANTGQEIRHTIEVPTGARNLSIAISGGSGDADLYVRIGAAPTTSSFNCRPYVNGNQETCSASAPGAGTYYIMVRGYSSFSGVTLRALYDEPVVQQDRPAPIPTSQPPQTPGSPTQNQPTGCMGDFEQAFLDAHNAYRAQGASCRGVFYAPAPPLTFSCNLKQASTRHSNDMASNNFFSHTGSDGSSFTQRITESGYSWSAAAENIAAGHPTVSAAVASWINSDKGHCETIMNPAFTQIGGARVFAQGAQYSSYWTAEFARPQ